jgi:anti-sigma regulatory factor (Ser/Thr protein kinase)
MIDVVIRLLSFCNQLIMTTRRVRLEFADGESGVMGYLDRMGFFDFLSPLVEVRPTKPCLSGARIHRGANRGLVEIERFSAGQSADRQLVPRLATTAERCCASRSDARQIKGAIFEIFGALVDNVFQHSGEQRLDAFAALQAYPKGDRLTVTVSDSGVGIMGSLRPALVAKRSTLNELSDVDLLVEIFREGISSLDDEKRGLGLKASARAAVKFKADLDVRLPQQRVVLKPANGQYRSNTAYSQEGLPLLWGTHISFSLNLT